jgi:hypothetical protein
MSLLGDPFDVEDFIIESAVFEQYHLKNNGDG